MSFFLFWVSVRESVCELLCDADRSEHGDWSHVAEVNDPDRQTTKSVKSSKLYLYHLL